MSRSKRAFFGAATSFLQYGLQIGLQIVLAPFVLSKAGQEVLGAYAILMQAVGFLNILDTAASITMSRFMAQALGLSDDGKRFDRLMSTGRTMLLITNFLFAIGAIGCSIFAINHLGMSSELQEQARQALFLLSIWAMVRAPIVIYGNGLNATQDLAYRNTVMAASSAIRILVSLGLVALGMGLVGLVLGYLVAEATDAAICRYRFRRKHPERHPGWGISDKELFREMVYYTLPVVLMVLSFRLVYYTDNLVVGFMFGAAAASVYYSTQMPAFMAWNGILRVADNVAPAMNELYARRETHKLKSGFLRLFRYDLLLALPLTIGVFALNKTLVSIWVGFVQYAGDLMTLWLAVFIPIVILSHLDKTLLMVAGAKMRAVAIMELLEGLGNIGLSIVLGRLIGLSGIMLATLLARIPTAIYLQYHAQKVLQIGFGELIRETVRPAIGASLVTAGALALMLNVMGEPENLIALTLLITIAVVVHMVSAWGIGLNRLERELVWSYLRRRFDLT